MQFLLIDVTIMGLKLSPSNTNKYITGTLNKGANGGKGVVFLGWNMGKGKGKEGKVKWNGEGKRKGKGRGRGKRREGNGREKGMG
jgi:hypothetical protein